MPRTADSWFDQGYQHLSEAAFEPAVACFRAALALTPEFLEARVNLGWALEQLDVLGEAEACYRSALDQDPRCLDALLNLGALLVRQKALEPCEAIYQEALRHHPEAPALWLNLGVLRVCGHREAEGEACFEKALALSPGYARPLINLSYLFLRQGRYEEGWRALQARGRCGYAEAFQFPAWQGQDPAGKALLIGVEAGHGDMIQLARYASVLKRRGAARVGIICHPALARLFRSLDGIDQIFALGTDLPSDGWDYWTLPFSLPLHCQTRVDNIPAVLPYLRPDPGLVAAWRSRLPQDGLRVGLAWKGNPRFENDRDRSLDHLAMLAPLGTVPGVSLVSLQKGPGEGEADLPPAGLSLLNLGPQIGDFADTAAIMASLDLVIAVDTAVAHLAGALGRPNWVLLPDYKTDWRWSTGRSDSLWYPGVQRLFRQSNDQTWAPVIREVAEHLAGFASASRGLRG